MEKLFKDILMPISLRETSGGEVERAISFANKLECNLHLLHIYNPLLFPATAAQLEHRNVSMNALKAHYASSMSAGELHTSVRVGHTESVVGNYAVVNGIDLILVNEAGKNLRLLKKLNVNRLADKTNCPVLSIKSDHLLDQDEVIVLPIGKNLPLKKLRVVIYIAVHFNAAVHLVSIDKNGKEDGLNYMQKAYSVLKENTDLEVKCNIGEGERLGDVAVEYAKSVNAGLIVVNSGAETMLSGIVNKWFPKFVFDQSQVPVMTVIA